MKISGSKLGVPFSIKGDWAKHSQQLKLKFPELTDADLKFEIGKESELLTRMATRLNKKQFEIMNIIRKEQSPKT